MITDVSSYFLSTLPQITVLIDNAVIKDIGRHFNGVMPDIFYVFLQLVYYSLYCVPDTFLFNMQDLCNGFEYL